MKYICKYTYENLSLMVNFCSTFLKCSVFSKLCWENNIGGKHGEWGEPALQAPPRVSATYGGGLKKTLFFYDYFIFFINIFEDDNEKLPAMQCSNSDDKESVKELLGKINRGETLNDKDKEVLRSLENEYPDAFDRDDESTSLEEILEELEEYLEDISGDKDNVEYEEWEETEKKNSDSDSDSDSSSETIVPGRNYPPYNKPSSEPFKESSSEPSKESSGEPSKESSGESSKESSGEFTKESFGESSEFSVEYYNEPIGQSFSEIILVYFKYILFFFI